MIRSPAPPKPLKPLVILLLATLPQCATDPECADDCSDRALREGTWEVLDHPWDDIVIESATLNDGILSIRYTTQDGSRYVAQLAITEE